MQVLILASGIIIGILLTTVAKKDIKLPVITRTNEPAQIIKKHNDIDTWIQ